MPPRDFQILPTPNFPEEMETRNLLAALPSTTEYWELVKYFEDYPPSSHVNGFARAFIYAMIRNLKPQRALEIGTLFAGTSEIIASALAANEQGVLTTIDPYGADRAPLIIGHWPQQLQDRVDFQPINSMQCFAQIHDSGERVDFIFVDGGHEYECALFDMLCSARYLNPGGVILLDNYNDHGVLSAARRFEQENPAWHVVEFVPHLALGMTWPLLMLGGLQRCYVAPNAIPIGAEPKAFHFREVAADGLRGIRLALAEPSPGGTLFYKVYLRIFPFEHHLGIGVAEEYATYGSWTVLKGAKDASLPLKAPLSTTRPREGFHRRFEIDLLFEGDSPGQPLLLSAEPVPSLLSR